MVFLDEAHFSRTPQDTLSLFSHSHFHIVGCEEMNPREKNQKIPRAEKEEKGRSQKREPDLSLTLTRLEFRSIVHIAERSLMGRSLSITRTIILES